MTIDERLEKLVERHEALTQSVELMAAENREMAAENRGMAAENREMAAENKKRDRRMGEVMEGLARLVHVAEIHEPRIERLEQN
jgi:hypothetical protein